MPRSDGNGPLGQGPMTGRGRGYCVLRSSKENPDQVDGFAGIGGKPVAKGDFAIREWPASPSESDSGPRQAKALLQEQLQVLEQQKHQIQEKMVGWRQATDWLLLSFMKSAAAVAFVRMFARSMPLRLISRRR